jgi:hypothetical protein
MRWAHQDRRKLARLPLEVFVRIQISGDDAVDFAETRNVSARGLYFHTKARLEPGQELECVLVLPEKLTQSPAPMLVGCRGKVLRVTPEVSADKSGVAVEIHTYDFSWQGSLSANPDEPAN